MTTFRKHSETISVNLGSNCPTSSVLDPFYLRGDFDGDGLPDYACLITSSDGLKRGIAVWLSSNPKARFQILGAGVPFQYGAEKSDDLNFNAWHVYGKRLVGQGASQEKPPRLRGEAILVEVKESASGLIYWNGKSFAWYQQGD